MLIRLEKIIAVGHRLQNKGKSDEWNRETYGKCFNVGGHGHNLKVVVKVRGFVNVDTGMVVNFSKIKGIIDAYDHQHLNDFMAIPTAENLVTKLLFDIRSYLVDNDITYEEIVVRVYESDDCYAENCIC